MPSGKKDESKIDGVGENSLCKKHRNHSAFAHSPLTIHYSKVIFYLNSKEIAWYMQSNIPVQKTVF
jgi:hypothetical protein